MKKELKSSTAAVHFSGVVPPISIRDNICPAHFLLPVLGILVFLGERKL
jgi:hypothetical protein